MRGNLSEPPIFLQWDSSSKLDYNPLLEFESQLTNDLSREHEADGHDFGSGEMDIFILTKDPKKAFVEVKRLVASTGLGCGMSAAFVEEAGDEYTILSPE